MKRMLSAVGWLALLFGSLIASANAQGSSATGLVALSKNFTGSIAGSSIELALSSNTECDQAQELIPEGSKLVSQTFSISADSNGVGTFQATASIVIPDGRVILQGSLRGTVGVNTRCGASQSCRLPWHLEGLFETAPSSFERFITRSTTNVAVGLMMLNFSADLNQQSASPVPIYRGRLDGLVPTLPAAVSKIGLAPDKSGYTVNDPLTAIITNGSEMAIQAYDLKSFCSIIQLQIQNGNQWDDVATCTLKRMSFPVTIPSGQRMDIPLLPTQTIAFPGPGTYRLALTFRFLGSNTPISDSLQAFSQPFVISPQPSSNTVTVKAERAIYQDREPVIVKVNNDLDRTIVAEDHKSYCSILYVQKQDGANWVNVATCLLATPTRLIKIGSHEDYFVKIANDDTASRLTPGTYRLELTYMMADSTGQPTGTPMTIYGPTFSVLGKE